MYAIDSMREIMRIIITGGAGFIGHHLALHLRDKGYEVLCIDNLSRASRSALTLLKSHEIPLIKMDVQDYDNLVRILSDHDIIVHAAALIDVEESLLKPLTYFENNALGTATLVKACVDNNVHRIIYLSSAAVYGNPISLPIVETHPVDPISPYGLSKAMGEEVIRLYSRISDLDYVVLRLFNVYGPRQSHSSYAGVIARFAERIRAGRPPVIFGDGMQTRDFIHVRDVCIAIERALTTEHVNQVYNIGSGNPTRIIDLAKIMIKLSGLKLAPIHIPPRQGDIRHSYADITKAVKCLGFRPSIELEEGIRELFQFSD